MSEMTFRKMFSSFHKKLSQSKGKLSKRTGFTNVTLGLVLSILIFENSKVYIKVLGLHYVYDAKQGSLCLSG